MLFLDCCHHLRSSMEDIISSLRDMGFLSRRWVQMLVCRRVLFCSPIPDLTFCVYHWQRDWCVATGRNCLLFRSTCVHSRYDLSSRCPLIFMCFCVSCLFVLVPFCVDLFCLRSFGHWLQNAPLVRLCFFQLMMLRYFSVPKLVLL